MQAHPMLQESWDEAAACAQIEYDQAIYQAIYQATQAAQAQAPVEPSDEPAPF